MDFPVARQAYPDNGGFQGNRSGGAPRPSCRRVPRLAWYLAIVIILQQQGDVLGKEVPDSCARVFVYGADLRDENAAAAVVDQTEMENGPIDILVNSAGAAKRTPPDELTPLRWHEAMDAKYFTYIHVIDPHDQAYDPTRRGRYSQHHRPGWKKWLKRRILQAVRQMQR